MPDKNETTYSQMKLMEEFEKISEKLRSMNSDADVNVLVHFKNLASEMLSTYKDVEQMHVNARIKEADAEIAKALNSGLDLDNFS